MAKGGRSRGRGRLSSFDRLPDECDGILSWAAAELSGRDRTQTEIYAEFVERCEALMAEHRGELEFDIPAFSSFNRHSMRLARLSRRLDQTREIVRSLSGTFDASDADDLTIMTAETIKSLVLHMLSEGEEGLETKDVMQLASAFRQAAQAQSISTDRRQKVNAEFDRRVGDAVDTVAKAKGLSAEAAEAIRAEILGVGA
ncbi:phage protein Gp27 family protein [Pseudoroseicyclus sp. H15]